MMTTNIKCTTSTIIYKSICSVINIQKKLEKNSVKYIGVLDK